MVRCIVEMYGLARDISGFPEVELVLEERPTLGDLVAALRREIPALEARAISTEEDRLLDGYVFNVGGHLHFDDTDLQLRNGDVVRLLSLAAGG